MRLFYHIKNLQSTKTHLFIPCVGLCFITLRIYKVLKPGQDNKLGSTGFITLRIYKVLKLTWYCDS